MNYETVDLGMQQIWERKTSTPIGTHGRECERGNTNPGSLLEVQRKLEPSYFKKKKNANLLCNGPINLTFCSVGWCALWKFLRQWLTWKEKNENKEKNRNVRFKIIVVDSPIKCVRKKIHRYTIYKLSCELKTFFRTKKLYILFFV
jgi:hypothetical protein